MAKKLGWRAAAVGLLALACLPGGGVALADVVPGDKITDQNLDKAKDLLSPGVEWCVKHGWPITIVESKRIDTPKAYKEATEKYAGQVKLAADGLSLQNYVAGLPFPNPDPKDPQFAHKVMWNYDYHFLTTDDVDLRNFDADTGAIADHGPLTVERHFLLDHFRRLFWNGRLYVDPKPEKPNANGYRAQQGLYPILKPFDLKGVGALGNRYIDAGKQDDSWLYLPSLRRVRRRPLRAGHRRRQLLRLQRPHRLDGLQVPRREGHHRGRAREELSGEVEREGRLGVRRGVGETPRLCDRRYLEAPAVRVLEARAADRQGDVGDPLLGHLRPVGRALEDLDQRHGVQEEGLRG